MAFVVTMRQVDIHTGGDARVILLRGHDAASFGINPGDRLQVSYQGRTTIAVADITHHSIRHGEVGVFEEVWKVLRAKDGQPLRIKVISRPPSVAAISKKLKGQNITEDDVRAIIQDIVDRRLSAIETTYFVASGYVKPYTNQELIWMVKAMAETGEMFHWGKRLVVDKHSVGGLAGNRTTMVAIPIVAALGLTIPKTSSRAITSPSGTADTMEVLAPVSFSGADVRRIVAKTGGCLIWGGGLSIAPADDIIIHVSKPLSLEPYDKMIVSIMAKKVAMGVKAVIIDMPYGAGTKIPTLAVARQLEKKFQVVAKAFKMKLEVKFDQALEPIGQGIGPALEARDVVRVLQQTDNRPLDLEAKAIGLATELLYLSGKGTLAACRRQVTDALRSGQAWKKMQQIIAAQGGQKIRDAEQLMAGAVEYHIRAKKSGSVKNINNRAIDEIARTLGAPDHKQAGIYLQAKRGHRVTRGDKIFTLYSYNHDRIHLALKALEIDTVMIIG